MNADRTVSIGSKATCDLQLDDPSVSGLHGQARLDEGRFLWVRDENSARGLHLKRNGHWVRARLVAVCTGDLLRFGDIEVEPERIVSLFGDNVDVRLAPEPESAKFDTRTGRYMLRNREDEPTLSTPRRNPGTGDIEEPPS